MDHTLINNCHGFGSMTYRYTGFFLKKVCTCGDNRYLDFIVYYIVYFLNGFDSVAVLEVLRKGVGTNSLKLQSEMAFYSLSISPLHLTCKVMVDIRGHFFIQAILNQSHL